MKEMQRKEVVDLAPALGGEADVYSLQCVEEGCVVEQCLLSRLVMLQGRVCRENVYKLCIC